MNGTSLIGENFPHKVAATFDDAVAAGHAKAALLTDGFDVEQVAVVAPADEQTARKLEPESDGIARTLVRSHFWLGLGGLLAGLVAAFAAMAAGVTMVTSSPALSVFVLAFLGTIAGLLLGGLVSLRPDHDPVVFDTKEASAGGQWTVVCHAADGDEKDRAREVLDANGGAA